MKTAKIALIPAYEPEPLLLALLEQVRQEGFSAVVVNDGSCREAEPIFEAARRYAVVLTHRENRGKGRALKTGLAYIQEHYPPGYVVVTMDADGQHRVTDAVRVCQLAEEHPDRLVLGSRRFRGGVPLKSRLGNTLTRFVYRVSTGAKLYDTQTGLRAFSSRLVPALLALPGERYEYEMNVLLACARRKIPVQEVEIETIYRNNNVGSHFRALGDSCRIFKEILKFSASSLVSFLVDYALYSLLLALTAGLGGGASLTASNVGARAVSASVNYTLNRNLVFQSDSSAVRSAGQYYLLAVVVLAGNTWTLHLLTGGLGVNRYAAKLCTELLFFLLSWSVQRWLIFRRKEM